MFVVFAYDTTTGLAVRDALRVRSRHVRFIDAASWVGESENGTAVVVLHDGATDGQRDRLKAIHDSFEGAHIVRPGNIAAFVNTVAPAPTMPEAPKTTAPAEIEPFEHPVALDVDPEHEPDPDAPPTQLGNTPRRGRPAQRVRTG